MRKNVLMLLLLLAFKVNAQKTYRNLIDTTALIGVWQINTAIVSDMYRANFHFFRNGTFIYYPMDELSTISSIKGQYTIEYDDTATLIYLRINEYQLLENCKLTPGAYATPLPHGGLFTLSGGTIKNIKAHGEGIAYIIYKCSGEKKEHGCNCIQIDHYGLFYKVSSNPNSN